MSTATEAVVSTAPAVKLLSPAEVKAWVEEQAKRLVQEWKTFSGEEMGNEEEYVFGDLAGIFCWCNLPEDRRSEADLFVATEEANALDEELDDDEPEEDSALEDDDLDEDSDTLDDDSDILDDDFEEVEDEDEEEDDDEFPLDERDDEDEPEEEEE